MTPSPTPSPSQTRSQPSPSPLSPDHPLSSAPTTGHQSSLPVTPGHNDANSPTIGGRHSLAPVTPGHRSSASPINPCHPPSTSERSASSLLPTTPPEPPLEHVQPYASASNSMETTGGQSASISATLESATAVSTPAESSSTTSARPPNLSSHTLVNDTSSSSSSSALPAFPPASAYHPLHTRPNHRPPASNGDASTVTVSILPNEASPGTASSRSGERTNRRTPPPSYGVVDDNAVVIDVAMTSSFSMTEEGSNASRTPQLPTYDEAMAQSRNSTVS